MSRTFSVLLTACGLCLLVLSPSTPLETEPLTSVELAKVVGSVDGYCCMPGQRLGCAASNFPSEFTECSTQTSTCHGNVVMDCTSADCQAAQPADSCDYSPQMVGRNRCKFTKTPCGTEEVCDPDYCYMDYVLYPPGYRNGVWHPNGWWQYEEICVEGECHVLQKYECVPSIRIAWSNDPGKVLRSVCDGGTTCTANYSKCEG